MLNLDDGSGSRSTVVARDMDRADTDALRASAAWWLDVTDGICKFTGGW